MGGARGGVAGPGAYIPAPWILLDYHCIYCNILQFDVICKLSTWFFFGCDEIPSSVLPIVNCMIL